jgi:hypothetical protein
VRQNGRFRARLSVALVLGACARTEETPNVECRSAAIVGGSERAEYLAIARAQESAIARLSIAGTKEGDASCSAVLVAPGVALTAAHCVPVEATALQLSFTVSGRASSADIALENVARHPELDLAVLGFPEDSTALSGVRPISIGLEYPSAPGALVQLGGHGLTENGLLEGLRFATERIVESSPDAFVVSADGRAGACDGDSGGPALSRDGDGSVRVVGVLSAGSASCTGTDRYVRLNGAGAWLAEHGVIPAPAEELADCALIGTEGRCFEGAVLSCPGGLSARVERCEGGARCGFDAGMFRCVPPALDACEGIGDLGACDGDDRLRCEGGSVTVAPCGACGATCENSVRDGRAICTR